MGQVIPIGKVSLDPLIPGVEAIHDIAVERSIGSRIIMTHRVEFDPEILGQEATDHLLGMYDRCCGPRQMAKVLEILGVLQEVSQQAGTPRPPVLPWWKRLFS